MALVSSTPWPPVLTRLALPLAPRQGEGAAAPVAVVNSVPPTATLEALAQDGAPAVNPTRPPSSTPVKALSKEELDRQVHDLQVKMDKLNPALAFVLDPDSGRALLQLTDRATKEVILQFPSQAALQISKALDQFQKGQLISRTV
jgi:flagellar protein FlaG